MDWMHTVLGLYALIAVAALMMTLREQLRQDGRGLMLNVAGYVACTLWPLAVVAVVISAQRRGV